MAYCVYTDLEARIGVQAMAELTNDTANSITTDQTAAASCITAADATIDALMTGTFATPFSSVPKIIKECSIRLAIHNAFLRRFSTMEEPKQWVAAAKEAMDWLGKIADLEMTLDTAPAATNSESDFVAAAREINFDDVDNQASYF